MECGILIEPEDVKYLAVIERLEIPFRLIYI